MIRDIWEEEDYCSLNAEIVSSIASNCAFGPTFDGDISSWYLLEWPLLGVCRKFDDKIFKRLD